MSSKTDSKHKISHKTFLNFWQKLPRPFFALAPMANVTDAAFRKMITKYGKPDVMWTEFVSADGLISAGQKKLLSDLKFSNNERPIVAQLFTSNPEAMCKASTLIAKLGFDGLDINMGCPDRAVEKNGGGAAMMKDPKLASAIIQAARDGVSNNSGTIDSGTISVSVKTRIGYNKIDMEWIKFLLEQRLPALTIHLRTRKEMSDAPAHWELMSEIIRMRDEISPETIVIGNGDVESPEMGAKLARQHGCDGVMIGRGIFGKPWLFENINVLRDPTHFMGIKPKKNNYAKKNVSTIRKILEFSEKTPKFRLKVMVEHAKIFEKHFKGVKNFDVMKKHFKAYVSGWNGAKELRVQLMGVKNVKEVERIVKDYLKLHKSTSLL